jgi:hypothetical protein
MVVIVVLICAWVVLLALVLGLARIAALGDRALTDDPRRPLQLRDVAVPGPPEPAAPLARRRRLVL